MARFQIRVHPRAKRNAVEPKLGEAYRLHLAAPPVEGKANDACIRYLAERFAVPRAAVRIVSGRTSRTKLIEVDGATAADVERILGGER
ncbi:MAG: DUF167 domain-containing protein [Bryobacterales bacterium]|jgi:uncharacterized protein|nr:DUF167 domain-containing protein [Bryobacterales bacterium]